MRAPTTVAWRSLVRRSEISRARAGAMRAAGDLLSFPYKKFARSIDNPPNPMLRQREGENSGEASKNM